MGALGGVAVATLSSLPGLEKLEDYTPPTASRILDRDGRDLNQIYLGSGAFGVQAAAHKYFGKDVKALDLGACALLAGLPKSPSGYDPFKFPDKAKARRAVVLGRMRDAGYIDDDTLELWKDA